MGIFILIRRLQEDLQEWSQKYLQENWTIEEKTDPKRGSILANQYIFNEWIT
jgi:hypothetical protein